MHLKTLIEIELTPDAAAHFIDCHLHLFPFVTDI